MNRKYQYPMDIYRVFKSFEEQNNWFLASDKILLEDYMIPKVIKNTNLFIDAPFDFGKLNKTGRIDVNSLAKDYRQSLINLNKIREEKFNYD